MTQLTAEQQQQRCDWVREIWADAPSSSQWAGLLDAVAALIKKEELDLDAEDFLALFKHPESHPELLNTLFEEYISRKLIGEAS